MNMNLLGLCAGVWRRLFLFFGVGTMNNMLEGALIGGMLGGVEGAIVGAEIGLLLSCGCRGNVRRRPYTF